MRQLLAFTLLAALICPAPASALCKQPTMTPRVLTASVTTSDGGIVVHTHIGSGGTSRDDGDAAQPTWEIKTKAGNVKPVMVTLAPGLVVYQLPAKVDGGELVDGATVLAKLARSKTAVPKLAAPKPAKITYQMTPSKRGNNELTNVVLGKDGVPNGAIALVIVDAKTMKPRSYGLVQQGVQEVAVYSRGRCSALPNGSSASIAGEKVILRWVDETGVVSADSASIVIKKA